MEIVEYERKNARDSKNIFPKSANPKEKITAAVIEQKRRITKEINE